MNSQGKAYQSKRQSKNSVTEFYKRKIRIDLFKHRMRKDKKDKLNANYFLKKSDRIFLFVQSYFWRSV